MHWILIVVIAHALNAVNFVLDKFLLSKAVKDSFVYTFAIGTLGILVLLLIPFGFEFPGWYLLSVNLITGVFFILALQFFFRSLQMNEASRIVPLIGSAIPVFTFILSFVFLSERLGRNEIIAFLFLLIGTYIITADPSVKGKKKFSISGLGIAILAAFSFSISFVLNKYIFESQPFFSGFIWIRIGSFLTVLLMLTKKNRISVKHVFTKTSRKIKSLFIANQFIGACAFLILSYAISLASVTLVNALQGVQYAILLIMAFIVSVKYPKILSENFTRSILTQKILAILFIGVGLFLLSFYAA